MLWRGREYIVPTTRSAKALVGGGGACCGGDVPTTRSAKALVSGGGACCGGEGSILYLPQGPLKLW